MLGREEREQGCQYPPQQGVGAQSNACPQYTINLNNEKEGGTIAGLCVLLRRIRTPRQGENEVGVEGGRWCV